MQTLKNGQADQHLANTADVHFNRGIVLSVNRIIRIGHIQKRY